MHNALEIPNRYPSRGENESLVTSKAMYETKKDDKVGGMAHPRTPTCAKSTNVQH